MEEQLLWEYRVQNFGNVWKSYKPEEMTAGLNLWVSRAGKLSLHQSLPAAR